MLRTEVHVTHTVGTQMIMEVTLVRRHITAQLFGALEDFGSGAFMHRTPTLPSPN
jgi:hypothetical protein